MSAADESERRDGFLNRWSRRKREEALETKPQAAPEKAENPSPPEEAEEDFDLSLLPDIESITAESDITLFFRKGVPDALKNAALRKIWTADPAIRDFVAPADFQWDFNAPDGVPGFGPLGGDFDLEAMLRQAVGEPAPEAASGVETPLPEAHPADAEEVMPASESSVDHDEEPAQDAAPRSSEQAMQGISISQKLHSENANFEIKADSGTKVPLPVRKHGGALPT